MSRSPTRSFVAITFVWFLPVDAAVCARADCYVRRRRGSLVYVSQMKPLPLSCIDWSLIFCLTRIRVGVLLQSPLFGFCRTTTPFVPELITTNDVATVPRYTCRRVGLELLSQSPLFGSFRSTSPFVGAVSPTNVVTLVRSA